MAGKRQSRENPRQRLGNRREMKKVGQCPANLPRLNR